MVNKTELFKRLLKWIIWYAAIILVLKIFGAANSFSIIHYAGLLLSVVIVDITYSKRHKMTSYNKEDDEDEE